MTFRMCVVQMYRKCALCCFWSIERGERTRNGTIHCRRSRYDEMCWRVGVGVRKQPAAMPGIHHTINSNYIDMCHIYEHSCCNAMSAGGDGWQQKAYTQTRAEHTSHQQLNGKYSFILPPSLKYCVCSHGPVRCCCDGWRWHLFSVFDAKWIIIHRK